MSCIGIIGGMGPMATVDLMHKIINFTDAYNDQDHIRIVVDNNTAIPDRTAALIQNAASPVPELIKSATSLQEIGADYLIMACNTAYCFYDEVQAAVKIPILHMIKECAKAAKDKGYKKAALLATNGVYLTGIYKIAFDAFGIKLIVPNENEKKILMAFIYDGIKASNYSYTPDDFLFTLASMKERGAECFILGCTELPIAFQIYNIQEKYLDPTEIIALAAIKKAGKKIKNKVSPPLMLEKHEAEN